MTDIAIHAEGLGKRYRIGEFAPYHRFSELLTGLATAPLRALRRRRAASSGAQTRPDHFWALHNVSFEVKRGEILGIIGRNGAGKSTLLKILSRITEPTEGHVALRGRVGSLLEVGTGFHPELTGRENIFLNGAILGMTSREIRGRFDEIVAFAEIDRFLDTPVKRYSSGMYMRLAFAVAAHLEPEILLIDEVLAVGDAAFQKKCLGKMDDVARSGRTVLFVSHNMGAVERLCQRGILLQDGEVVVQGEIAEVIEGYGRTFRSVQARDLDVVPRRANLGRFIRIIGCELLNSDGDVAGELRFCESFKVRVTIRGLAACSTVVVFIAIDTPLGQRIASCSSFDSDRMFSVEAGGTIQVTAAFEGVMLQPGQYTLSIDLHQGRTGGDQLLQCHTFEVSTVTMAGHTPPLGKVGYFRITPEWQ